MRRAFAILFATMVSASPLAAQQWSVDVQAGRIRSALDPNAPQAESVVLGLRYDDVLTAFRISGGVPTSTEEPLWGAVSGARRVVGRAGDFFGGVDLGGNAFVVHDRNEQTRTIPGRGIFEPPTVERVSSSGTAFAVQALPVLGYENARAQAFVRGGVSLYRSSFGEQTHDRTVRLGEAQLLYSLTPALAVIPSVRHYRADEGNYTFAGATAMVTAGVTTLWAAAGRMSGVLEQNSWGAGASVRVHDRASINLSVREDPSDPLYLTPPQRAWSAGVSLRVGGGSIPVAPVPARYENGKATIRLPSAQARTQPRIAGDFTKWKPVAMQRSGNDWVYTTTLEPGVYNFAFVDDKGEWFVPEKYPGRKDDGMGGHVAVVVVQQ